MTRMIALALVVGFAGLAAAQNAEPPASAGAPAMRRPAPHVAPPRGGEQQADLEMVPSRPVPQPPPIVVAPEIAQRGKQLAGAYTCKGVELKGDGSSTPLEAKITIKLALGNAWIVTSMAETKVGGMKFEEYRTYDATAKQWTRIQMASTSAHVVATSLGEKAGVWAWDGTVSSPIGNTTVRDFEQLTGKDLKIWGEAMMSGTWQKVYEATCKR